MIDEVPQPWFSMASAGDVRIVSRTLYRPSSSAAATSSNGGDSVVHLNPWDLRLLTIEYNQKGLLFSPPPAPEHDSGSGGFPEIVDRLRRSFFRAVDGFYPLAGRLATVVHNGEDGRPSISVSLDCGAGEGVEFVHASAPLLSAAEIGGSPYIPAAATHGLFPLNGAVNHDGHSLSLFSVQITELAGGAFFVSGSLNHAVADGVFFWHFFNTWSEICRGRGGGPGSAAAPRVLDRWFDPSSPPPPIRLPFSVAGEYVVRRSRAPVSECFFNFTAESIRCLKDKANAEAGDDKIIISSLQALLAHAWRAATRARNLPSGQEVSLMVLVGCRRKLDPPLPNGYLGNAFFNVWARATAGELLGGGLGRAALIVNRAVELAGPEEARRWTAAWRESPEFVYPDAHAGSGGELIAGSSPRFDIFGNDFGWGRPAAVRCGGNNKNDGMVSAHEGPEPGSMALEVSLSPPAMAALVDDGEFTAAVRV